MNQNTNNIKLDNDFSKSKETNDISLKSSVSNNRFSTLCPPGKFFHLMRNYSRKESNVENKANFNGSKRQFKDILKNLNRLKTKAPVKTMPIFEVKETDINELNEILISPQILKDHLPNNLIKCMNAVIIY